MKYKARKITELALLAGVTIALSGCASLRAKTLKAPCSSPSAGMTDPCGNRTPINSDAEIESIFAEELSATKI